MTFAIPHPLYMQVNNRIPKITYVLLDVPILCEKMMKSDKIDEKTILVLYHVKNLLVHPQLLIFKTSSGADLIPVGSIIGHSVLVSSSFSHPY